MWVICWRLPAMRAQWISKLTDVCLPGTSRELKLYQHVIQHAKKWGNEDQLMFVIGATPT
jgi:hypothetical protein